MLVEFSGVVQKLTESLDREVKTDEILKALLDEYVVESGPYRLVDFDLLTGRESDQRCVARVEVSQQQMTIDGEGSGPIEAFVNGLVETLNEPLTIVDYHEHALTSGSDAQAICLLAIDDEKSGRCYGAGLSRNTIAASLIAVMSAMNRRWKS
jgi:2-isopropylmalate synthase